MRCMLLVRGVRLARRHTEVFQHIAKFYNSNGLFLELRPPFTGPEVQSFHGRSRGHLSPEVSSTGQASDPIRHLSILQSPVFLVNSRHPRVVPPLLELLSEHVKALLFPKLRRKFAEFLQRSSLKRLSGTHSVTCGGLGYGACYIPCFLGEYRTPKRNPITLEVPWIVVAYIHTMAEKHRNTPRTMCFPIKCGFRLFLRDRLTLHR
jgi:hypothetical protein